MGVFHVRKGGERKIPPFNRFLETGVCLRYQLLSPDGSLLEHERRDAGRRRLSGGYGGFSASFFSCNRRCFSFRSSFVKNMSGTDMMSFALGARITSSSLPQYDASTTASNRSCFPLLLSFYSSAVRLYSRTVLFVLRFAATPFFSSFSFGLSAFFRKRGQIFRFCWLSFFSRRASFHSATF